MKNFKEIKQKINKIRENLKKPVEYNANAQQSFLQIMEDENEVVFNNVKIDLNNGLSIKEIYLNPNASDLKPCVEEERIYLIIQGRISETFEILQIYGKTDLKEIGLSEKAMLTFNVKNNRLCIITDANISDKESVNCEKFLQSCRDNFIKSINNDIEFWNNLSPQERHKRKEFEKANESPYSILLNGKIIKTNEEIIKINEEKEQSLFDEEELKPSQNNQSSNSRDEYIEKQLRKRGRVY